MSKEILRPQNKPLAQPAEPPPWWAAVEKILEEYGLQAIDFAADFKEAMKDATRQEPVSLRRGDILRCIETDELCAVWATSTTGKTLVKWSANNFGNYTAEQIGELFWLEPAPVHKPVAWMDVDGNVSDNNDHNCFSIPLYTTPNIKSYSEKDNSQPEQEPVGWLGFNPRFGAPEFACDKPAPSVMRDFGMKPLAYTNTTPPQRPWVGLTDEERVAVLLDKDGKVLDYEDCAEAIEAKLRSKNT